ncbi:MAG: RNA polymerase-binding protein DksA [Thiomonas sp.]|nr:RNA polymerase-binding protein DksA [Thiomonas sp.]
MVKSPQKAVTAPGKGKAVAAEKKPAVKAAAGKTKAAAPAAPAQQSTRAKPVTSSAAKTPATAVTAPLKPVTPAPAAKKVTPAPALRRSSSSGVSKLHASKPLSAAMGSPEPIRLDRSSMSSTITQPTPRKADPKHANAWKNKSASDLTEQDLLAMPENEYMNEVQLDYFKRLLSTMREDLIKSAGETTEHLREDTLLVPDPADRATIEEEHALELRTRDRERKLLKKIEQSLQRIDSGDYGWCEETGEPIGIGRLLARPTATLSLEAQQRRELKQKMFND